MVAFLFILLGAESGGCDEDDQEDAGQGEG